MHWQFSQLGCFVGPSAYFYVSQTKTKHTGHTQIDQSPFDAKDLTFFLGFTVLAVAEACMACIGHLSVSFVQLSSQLVGPAESGVCIPSTCAENAPHSLFLHIDAVHALCIFLITF